jgi:hypothetical protein
MKHIGFIGASGLNFGLYNASKDLRYYVHLTESVKMPSQAQMNPVKINKAS